jgi:hypothetical protein
VLDRQAQALGGVLGLNGRRTHAHLMARHLHDRATIGGQPDACCAARHAVIGISRSSDAVADQPIAFAP